MIARRTPLKRTPFRRGAKKSKYARRPRAIDYMLFVKTLPCAAFGVSAEYQCDGPIEADHAGERGLGQKSPDSTCIPLCSSHHRHRHNVSGAFAGWSRERMRAWLNQRICVTQRLAMGMRIEVPTETT